MTFVCRILICISLLGTASNTLRVYPHHLAYFNELAGGPENGHCHLLGSNLDWGQDLVLLKDWLHAHPYQSNGQKPPLTLVYYGGFDPSSIGLSYQGIPVQDGNVEDAHNFRPGLYAISINFLCGDSRITYGGSGDVVYSPDQAVKRFRDQAPIARCGHTILLFRMSKVQSAASGGPLPGHSL